MIVLRAILFISIFTSSFFAYSLDGPNESIPSYEQPNTIVHQWAFTHEVLDWETGVANYRSGTETDSSHEIEPQSIFALEDGFVMTGLKLQSTNYSSETSMSAHTRITDLLPSTTYNIEIYVTFATNVSDQCMGIGSAPHEVQINASALSHPPELFIDNNAYVRSTLYTVGPQTDNDSHQSISTVTLGHIGSRLVRNCDPKLASFHEKALSSRTDTLTVRTNALGELWMALSTYSAFEGLTTIYLLDAEVMMRPA